MLEQQERAELEAVLASTVFGRAPDLSKILRYVCEKRFANQADTIKEYNIAVEALGRGPDFRPEEDSIVRVQAARLRKHLKRYYDTDGAGHPVQIRISPSGYKPEFIHVGRGEGQPAEAAAAPTPATTMSEMPLAQEAVDTAGVQDVPAEPRPSPLRNPLVWALSLVVVVVLVAAGARAFYRPRANPTRVSPIVPAPPAESAAVRIHAGLEGPAFLDAEGRTWSGDRYFVGGTAYSQTSTQIVRTFDQPLYQNGRRGAFRYAIPVRAGIYELHLHFAEVFFGLIQGADSQRTFNVSINGEPPVLDDLDIATDAGGVYVADEKVFKDVAPMANGSIHLDFRPNRSYAILNAIEVLPGVADKMLPVRLVCSNHSVVDKDGQLWTADRYFSGGRICERGDPMMHPILGGLSSYRTGNFTYAIPVAAGSYQIRLIFAEPVYGRDFPAASAPGHRVFDVYCNGKTLVSGIDIFEEAGGAYRILEKTFRRIKPTAQGKIHLSFVPVKTYAVLLAIEVLDENW